MPRKPEIANHFFELRRGAEARLRKGRKGGRPGAAASESESEADTMRLLHELQVHQIELEMQNRELQEARNRTELLLDTYTDLYDFAPVGYFSLDEQGTIRDVNLTGTTLLGVERSRLVSQRLLDFVNFDTRPIFKAFLERIFAGAGNEDCEVVVSKRGAGPFWASLHGAAAPPFQGRKQCRVAVSDITSLKHGVEARRRMEALAQANRDLTREIGRREAVEQALRKSDAHTRQLLNQSRKMQDQLRQVSRAVLSVQEEERKRIARESHDIVAQTLTSINVRLANLKHAAETKTRGLDRHIARTQQLVEASVAVVHRFARELRPTVLDDLGLIPALHAFLKSFREQTGIQVSFSVFAGVEQMKKDKQTTLFRVAQEALANVARHAHASRAEVKISKLEGAVCMRIRDNGTGFQLQRRLRAKRRKQLGILGMRERLEMVGGELTIISAPGKGTTILAKIPQRDQTAKKRPRKNRAIR